MRLKLTKTGNSIGVVLPKEVRDRMKLGAGDTLYLSETQEGYKILPYDEEFARQMDVARKVMAKHRAAFHTDAAKVIRAVRPAIAPV